MKKLSLTKAEYSALRQLYQDELDKAQRRIEHLVSVLKKMDTDFDEPEITIPNEVKKAPVKVEKVKSKGRPKKVEKKPETRKPKVAAKAVVVKEEKTSQPFKKVVAKKTTQKRGRKPLGVRKPIKKGTGGPKEKWNDFVLNSISQAGKPVLSTVVTNEAFEKFKVSEAEKPRVKQVISGALSKLVTTEKKLKAKKLEGSREKLYGLPNWFDAESNVKA